MAMHVLGTATGSEYEDAKPYAIQLGDSAATYEYPARVAKMPAGAVLSPARRLATLPLSEKTSYITSSRSVLFDCCNSRWSAHITFMREAWPVSTFILQNKPFFGGSRGGRMIGVFWARSSLTATTSLRSEPSSPAPKSSRRLPFVWMRLQRDRP